MYSKKINQLATNLNPQSTDLIPIGDATTGQLKTTTYNAISGISSDGVISGGIVTWTSIGLTFNISACVYYLNGIRYASPFTTKTLDPADATNPRIDVFAVNTSGEVQIIKGTPAANPVEPEGDTPTTLGLTNVTINAGATSPNAVTRDLLYDENVESWTKTELISNATFDYNNTTFPYTGSKSLLVISTGSAHIAEFRFSKATEMDVNMLNSLSFAIRLNSALSTTVFSVRFYNGTKLISNTYALGSNNTVGFNRNLAGVYQFITIPLDGTIIKFKENSFTEVRINSYGIGTTYRLDTISLSGGIDNPTGGGTTSNNSFGFVNGSTGTASSTQATDTLNVVGSGLITTSATDKTLTIASNQIATGSILGRVTAGTGNIETLTGTQTTTLLDVFTSTLKGLAPASGGGTTNFLRADGTWAAAGGGTTIYTGDGTLTANRTLTSGGFNLIFTGTNTAASGITRGLNLTHTLVASANNDVLVGLDINSIFTVGSFTGLTNSPLRLTGNGNYNTSLQIRNTSTGTNSAPVLLLIGDNAQNTASFGKASTSYTTYKAIQANDAYIYSSSPFGGDIVLQTDGLGAATSKIKFASGGSSTAQMTLGPTGNLGLGTITPSYLFDIPAHNTSLIQHRVGTFQVQSYSLNNGFLSDNMYFNGTSWTRTTTGFGYGFQFYNGQLMLHGIASGTGIFTQNVKFKFDQEGAFVIGNNIPATAGSYTGATALFTKNGRLLLGTISESTYILDAVGNSRVYKDQNAETSFTVSNITSGTSSSATTIITSNSGSAKFGKYSTTSTTFKIIDASDSYIYNGNLGDIAIINDVVGGKIKFGGGGTSIAQMTLTAAGRLLLGTTSEDASAILKIDSTASGFLPPRMTTTQKNAIGTPAIGLIVYDTTLNKLCVRTASAWETITSI